MNRKVINLLISLGFLFIILSIVGFIPKINVDYGITSTIFIIGLVLLVFAFFIKGRSSGRGKRVTKVKKNKRR